MRKYFLFDTETGGLDAKRNSLLSLFGLILDEKLNIVDNINLNIKPDDGIYHLDIEAMKVNRIDILKHNETAIPETVAGIQLRNFLFRHSGPSSLLIPSGHNIGRLDIPMGERLVRFEDWKRTMSHRTVDTATIAHFLILQGILPETNNCSLKDPYELLLG
jgi:DNA polymerase III alpha subunit (gram-positive type)